MRTVLITVGLIAIAAPTASSQTLLQHFPQATINQVAARFSKAFRGGGMMAVIADIKACYAATSFKETRENGQAIAACMLYDYSAHSLDSGMRTNFVAQGLNDPGNVTSYLSDKAMAARFEIYAPIPFGHEPAAVGTYFADAPDQVLKQLKMF